MKKFIDTEIEIIKFSQDVIATSNDCPTHKTFDNEVFDPINSEDLDINVV